MRVPFLIDCFFTFPIPLILTFNPTFSSNETAVSLLENVGLNVKIKGIGKVKKQSIKKGTLIKKGATIILNLS